MPKSAKQFIREGKPTECVVCAGKLHHKSEYYCSMNCALEYEKSSNGNPPPFLSKWKMRKRKESKDPLIKVRKKAREKSNRLLKAGKIKRKPCVVCGSVYTLIHHEDYEKPWQVLWLCEKHHKEYHDGKIGLFNNELWWDPCRLVPKRYQELLHSRKYRELKRNYDAKVSKRSNS